MAEITPPMPDEHAHHEYDQGTDFELLVRLLDCLDNKTVVDVGAEKGSFVRALLKGGAEAVYAFEPHPDNAAALRSAFAETPAVHVFEMAIADHDGSTVLHIVEDKSARHPDAFHTLIGFEETTTLRITDSITVEARTLDSLVSDGVVPSEIGILKVDAERSDFAVLQGMGQLSCTIVMIEFWDDLQGTVGPAPYRLDDVVSYMAERSFGNFALIKRYDQFETIQLNEATIRPGDWGNAIFIHDTAFARLAPVLFQAVAATQQRLVDKAIFFAGEADRRLAIIDGIQGLRQQKYDSVLETRLEVLEDQERAIETYLRHSHDSALWKWVAPQLGVLYQYDPAPFHVPEHYLRSAPLSSPPKISIVTPTMNSEQFVMYTIHSILDQSYENLEYIVQDGGSTDSTLSILESYGPRIATIHSERDTGMAQAINRGFAHATGEIMAYLNSDDVLLPGSLQFVAVYFATHPDVDVVYGHRVIINKSHEEIGRWVLPPHDSAVLSWADYVPQETLFWRRRVWERIGSALDETFRFALDWDLLLRLREAGATFARLPRFLGAFRVHEEQKTSRELADIGAAEMNRLREHYAGRPVSPEEVWRYLQPYMYQHKVYHKLYRLGVLRY